MGNILENRSLDWVTAPGDEYILCNCPPPPGCSPSLYISSLWLQTSGTITVEEVASPGDDPLNVSTSEQQLYRKYAKQSLMINLGPALKAAEKALSTAECPVSLKDADITLTPNALKIMNKAFKIREEWVLDGSGDGSCCPPPDPTPLA